MHLARLETRDVPGWWPKLRDDIAQACERSGGKYEAADILSAAFSGQMNLWLVIDADTVRSITITEIVAYPRLRVCKLLACTGDGAKDWAHLVADIEAWAREQGCAVMEPICRPGWEKLLGPLGYRRTHIVMEKTL